MSDNNWLESNKINSSNLLKNSGDDLKFIRHELESRKSTADYFDDKGENGREYEKLEKIMDEMSLFSFNSSFSDFPVLYNTLPITNEKHVSTNNTKHMPANEPNMNLHANIILESPVPEVITELANSSKQDLIFMQKAGKRKRLVTDLSFPPRPQNCFIIYRTYIQPIIKKVFPMIKNMELSKVASEMWHMESKQFQEYFKHYAESLKNLHQQAFPDFVYNKRKLYPLVQGESSRKRKERIRHDFEQSCSFNEQLQQQYLDLVEKPLHPPPRLNADTAEQLAFEGTSAQTEDYYEKKLVEKAMLAFQQKVEKTGSPSKSLKRKLKTDISAKTEIFDASSLAFSAAASSSSTVCETKKRGRPLGKKNKPKPFFSSAPSRHTETVSAKEFAEQQKLDAPEYSYANAHRQFANYIGMEPFGTTYVPPIRGAPFALPYAQHTAYGNANAFSKIPPQHLLMQSMGYGPALLYGAFPRNYLEFDKPKPTAAYKETKDGILDKAPSAESLLHSSSSDMSTDYPLKTTLSSLSIPIKAEDPPHATILPLTPAATMDTNTPGKLNFQGITKTPADLQLHSHLSIQAISSGPNDAREGTMRPLSREQLNLANLGHF